MKKPIAFLACLMLAACSATGGGPREWVTETAFEAGHKLGGCTVGDLDAERPGDELVAVGVNGDVHMVWREGDGWGHELLATLSGEMIACAVGDVRADLPGNELVTVGMLEGGEDGSGKGAAWLIRREGDGWDRELVCEDAALIHGVCVGDFDPWPGDEILMVGFSLKARVASYRNGAWHVEAVCDLPGPGKNAVPYQKGFVVACSDGSLAFRRATSSGAWSGLDEMGSGGRARLASFKVRDASWLLVAQDNGTLALQVRDETGVQMYGQAIHTEDQKLRGAVLSDLEPGGTPEAATAGYSGRIVLLRGSEDGWKWTPEVLYQDDERLHHLASGRPAGLGPSLVACGYSGRLLVVHPAGD